MKWLALLFSLMAAATAVSAAGIGVAPAELSFSVEKGKAQQRELTVYNLENSEVGLEATSDSPSLKLYHSGAISANGKGKVVVEADAKRLKQGNYTVYITAKNQAPGVRLSIGTAVKASVTVFTLRKTNAATGVITSAAIVVTGLLAYLAAARLRGSFASQNA